MARQSELARIQAEIDRLTIIRDYLKGAEKPSNGPQPARRGSGRVTAAKAAEGVLRAHGQPMKTTDLLTEVQARGSTIKDTDGLYKTLDRDKDRFKRVGRGLWALAED